MINDINDHPATLEFFDCNCIAGRRRIVNPGSFYSKDELVEKLAYYGIKRALVYHSMAREYAPVTGNSMLAEEIKNYPVLYPVWVVMPHHTGEFPTPDVLREQLKENGIRFVCMFPGAAEQNYSINEWSCGELFRMLEACRVPVFIGIDQMSWDDLYILCRNHPEMRIILTDLDYRADRHLYPLLSEFEHIHMVTIGYKVHQGIEEICRKFGAGRLIFGSGMPVYSGGSAVSMINYARISDDEKKMIAFGNLERLMEGVML